VPGDGSAIVRLRNYGLESPKVCASIQGELIGILEIAGASQVESSHPRCRSSGDELCEWSFSWISA
jgi:hypothetical protein